MAKEPTLAPILSDPDKAFAEAIDNAIQRAAADVADARDDVLVAATALSFDLLSQGETIDGAAFLQLRAGIGQELAFVVEAKGDKDRSECLGIALNRVAERFKGKSVLPIEAEA